MYLCLFTLEREPVTAHRNDGTRVHLSESGSFIGVPYRNMNALKSAPRRSHLSLTKVAALEFAAWFAGSSVCPGISLQQLRGSEIPVLPLFTASITLGRGWGILPVSAFLKAEVGLPPESSKPLPPRRRISVWRKLVSNAAQPFSHSFLQDSTPALKGCLSLVISLCGSRYMAQPI